MGLSIGYVRYVTAVEHFCFSPVKSVCWGEVNNVPQVITLRTKMGHLYRTMRERTRRSIKVVDPDSGPVLARTAEIVWGDREPTQS